MKQIFSLVLLFCTNFQFVLLLDMNSSCAYNEMPILSRQFFSLRRNPSFRRSRAMRILLSITAFIKLLESLFWLSLLLEATINEEDHSTVTLGLLLATAFITSLINGFVSLFGPCFRGLIQYQIILLTTITSFVWCIVMLTVTFILGTVTNVYCSLTVT